MIRRCDECHVEPAAVSLQQGEKVIHLCSGCAAGHGIKMAGEGMGATALAMMAGTAPGAASCPGCGATVASLRASGRLGCSECWSTFEVLLRPLVVRIHGSDRHTGRGYIDPSGERAPEDIVPLEMALRSAVAAEAFEEAARIRDEITARRRGA